MANEITITARLQCLKGSLDVDRYTNADTATMTGTRMSSVVQSIPTTAGGTAVEISTAVGTAGWTYLKNCSSSNFVTIGVKPAATYYPVIKLLAGEGAVFRLSDDAVSTLYALADTAAVDLEVTVLEQ